MSWPVTLMTLVLERISHGLAVANSRVLPGLVLESKVISRPKYLSLLDYMTVAIATMTGGPRESVQKLFDYERTYDLDRKVEGAYAI
jgi:hypothetical protein